MISTVAVGTDGSDTAREAVRMAAELAGRFGAEIVLVSAFNDSDQTPVDRRATGAELQWAFSSSARLREMLSRTEDELRLGGIRCRTLVDEGDPGDVLVQLATACGADVLVIGNKGMHRRVLGSVPNTITHQAPCTVLVVKTT